MKKALVLRDENITRIVLNCPTLKKAKDNGLNTRCWDWEKVTEAEAEEILQEMKDYNEPHNVIRL